MFETYSMLGREHEADLAREAERRRQASLVHPKARKRRGVLIPRLPSLRRLSPERLSRPEGSRS